MLYLPAIQLHPSARVAAPEKRVADYACDSHRTRRSMGRRSTHECGHEALRGTVMARLEMLPVFDVIRDGRPLSLPVRAQRLVALLAVSGGTVTRSTAAEQLWPDVI